MTYLNFFLFLILDNANADSTYANHNIGFSFQNWDNFIRRTALMTSVSSSLPWIVGSMILSPGFRFFGVRGSNIDCVFFIAWVDVFSVFTSFLFARCIPKRSQNIWEDARYSDFMVILIPWSILRNAQKIAKHKPYVADRQDLVCSFVYCYFIS